MLHYHSAVHTHSMEVEQMTNTATINLGELELDVEVEFEVDGYNPGSCTEPPSGPAIYIMEWTFWPRWTASMMDSRMPSLSSWRSSWSGWRSRSQTQTMQWSWREIGRWTYEHRDP